MQSIKLFVSGLVGAFIILLVVFVLFLESRPDLHVWHLAELDEEFTVSSPVESFEEYLALEDRLFRQLHERVYQQIDASEKYPVNRYYRGSESDPDRWPVNLNRSFELAADSPRAGVLLLHGMSDSPYSLHNLGTSLNESGAWVIGLRLPGHGTAPSGLVHARWQDMAAAVKIAMGHLRGRVGDAPIYVVGYSNGGALAVHYSQVAMDDDSLPRANGLVLVSPAIGVSSVAVLAVWQARLGDLLGLDKLSWNSLLPEYDPFKYGSFAVNAGDQVYRLTTEIQSLFDAQTVEELRRFPPVLAFQSVVDATVSTPALVKGLFSRLPENGHELVLFDINRDVHVESLMVKDPRADVKAVLENVDSAFAVAAGLKPKGPVAAGKGGGCQLRKRPPEPRFIELTDPKRLGVLNQPSRVAFDEARSPRADPHGCVATPAFGERAVVAAYDRFREGNDPTVCPADPLDCYLSSMGR